MQMHIDGYIACAYGSKLGVLVACLFVCFFVQVPFACL